MLGCLSMNLMLFYQTKIQYSDVGPLTLTLNPTHSHHVCIKIQLAAAWIQSEDISKTDATTTVNGIDKGSVYNTNTNAYPGNVEEKIKRERK
eukprot:334647-Amorphochlora_amoeboformis.AAC.1